MSNVQEIREGEIYCYNRFGVVEAKRAEEQKLQKWLGDSDLIYRLGQKLMSLCIPYMKRGAKIINVSSASSFQPNPYLSMYSASKVFLKNLSRAVSVELKSRGITVTCVCPGWIDTEMLPDEKDGEKIHYTGKISAGKVVKKAMRDCLKGKDISTPGAFASYFRIYSKYTPTKIVMKQWVKAIRRYVS